MLFRYTYEHPTGFFTGSFTAEDVDEAIQVFDETVRIKNPPNETLKIYIYPVRQIKGRTWAIVRYLKWAKSRWKFEKERLKNDKE